MVNSLRAEGLMVWHIPLIVAGVVCSICYCTLQRSVDDATVDWARWMGGCVWIGWSGSGSGSGSEGDEILKFRNSETLETLTFWRGWLWAVVWGCEPCVGD